MLNLSMVVSFIVNKSSVNDLENDLKSMYL